MLKFSDLKVCDTLVSNFDEFEGEVIELIKYYKTAYVKDSKGSVRCVRDEELNGYSKKEDPMLIRSTLSRLEIEILEKILNGEIEGTKKNDMDYPTVAYIVWIDNGEVNMGPVRWAHQNNYHTNEGVFNSWSASPFPGAWAMVPISKIVRVRHVNAI
jgi:hypothetical protein